MIPIIYPESIQSKLSLRLLLQVIHKFQSDQYGVKIDGSTELGLVIDWNATISHK